MLLPSNMLNESRYFLSQIAKFDQSINPFINPFLGLLTLEFLIAVIFFLTHFSLEKIDHD